jgi:hypothetical protein
MSVTERTLKQWFTAAAIATLVCGAAADARAEHVVLTNNDALTGTVTAVTKDDVKLDTELAGHVSLKWSAVASYTGTKPVRLTLSSGSVVEGTFTIASGRVVVQQPNGTMVPVDLSAIRTMQLAATADAATWHGAVNAGVDVSRGNTETAAISTNGVFTRLRRSDRLGLFGTYLFSSVGSGASAVTTARTTRAGLRYDHDVAGRAYAFGFGDVENDPLELLDLRTVVGGGAGVHALKSDDAQFNVFAGVSYAKDSYADVSTATPTTPNTTATNPAGKNVPGLSRGGTPPSVVRTTLSRSVGEFLVGQDLWKQFSSSVGLNEQLTFYPAIGDLQDYRVSFDLSLSAQINGRLQWNVSVADRFLNIPPAGGAVQNDIFISTGLGITFGNGADGAYTGSDGRRAAPPRK